MFSDLHTDTVGGGSLSSLRLRVWLRGGVLSEDALSSTFSSSDERRGGRREGGRRERERGRERRERNPEGREAARAGPCLALWSQLSVCLLAPFPQAVTEKWCLLQTSHPDTATCKVPSLCLFPEPASLSPGAVWANHRPTLNQGECISPWVS